MKTVLGVRDALRKKIAERARRVSDELSSGQASDYAAYMRRVGRIQGHHDALDCIEEVFKEISNDEE